MSLSYILREFVFRSYCRAKLKYKTIAIAMSILMIYMVVASIICAIQAVRQGGTTNSVMLFSILITFGCVYFSLSTVEYVTFLIAPFLSVCI